MKRRDLLVGGASAAAVGTAAWLISRRDGSGDSHAAPPKSSDPPPKSARKRGARRPSSARPNILLVSLDDMKPWTGPHGVADAHTPALDELARHGLIFLRAYCAAPACSPSRAAVFTGLAPHQTGCYLNRHNWLFESPRPVTLPRLLRQEGYATIGLGKLFHTPHHDDKDAWTERHHYNLYKMPNAPINAPKSIYRRSGSRFDWAALDVPVERMDDHLQVDRAIAAMKKQRDRPWFVACGIFRPHLPWYVPRRFFDLHPLDSVEMPEVIANDLDDVPPRGRKFAKVEEHRIIVKAGLWREAVQAYKASISYVDYELGRLLADTPPDTFVLIWSDHGFHLGPKNHWHKYALWEEATQTVFAMTGPGVATGKQCGRTVSLNDIYPTICELTQIEAPHPLFGRSALPLAHDPSAAWDRPALTTYGPGNHSIRDERYRYIRYDDNSEELYDHDKDPHEWTNLAGTRAAAPIIEKLAPLLPRENARPLKPTWGKGAWLELPDGRRALLPA